MTQVKQLRMNNSKQVFYSSRLRSIKFALHGIRFMVKTEPNARIHLAVTILVIIAGMVLGLSAGRWLALLFAISIVWITEAVNTALERLCDYASDKEYSTTIKAVKDVAAGAVFIAAICSILTGIVVFTIK